MHAIETIVASFGCDQCQAARINGVFCHETGCPNEHKVYVPDRAQWVKYVECRECGDDVEEGESCDCATVDWEPDFTEDDDE